MGNTNLETATAFVRCKKLKGKSSNGNLWFEGDTIYSYGKHFPIAKRFTNHDGYVGYLVTTQRDSVTTNGKHIPAVNRALGYGFIRTYRVPFVNGTVAENIAAMQQEVRNAWRSYENSRAGTNIKAQRYSQHERLLINLNLYIRDCEQPVNTQAAA